MTWLVVVLIVALIGGLIGYFASGGDKESALNSALQAGAGCGYLIFVIFILLVGLALLLALGNFLFS